jgi:hypothetical protein
VSSHNKNRLRLKWLVNNSLTTQIFISDIHVLGDTIEDILDIYRKCSEYKKGILILDFSQPNKIGEFSTCDSDGNLLPKEEINKIIDKIAQLEKTAPSAKKIIKNGRGTNRLTITKEFWDAYFLYDITMEIPEDLAFLLSNMSKNSFRSKCMEMEEHYDKLIIQYKGKYYTYAEMLDKTIKAKDLTYEHFYNSPKRFGAIPKSDKLSFDELMTLMQKKEAQTSDINTLQKELDTLCNEKGFPIMHYFNYKRYCAKKENPSKRTFSKFFNYNEKELQKVQNYKNSINQKTSIINNPALSNELLRDFLIQLYSIPLD